MTVGRFEMEYLAKTCDGCGARMAVKATEAPITDVSGAEPSNGSLWAWECPQCQRQDEIGPDVLAQLEGRPKLL